jgi:hypothetical protein
MREVRRVTQLGGTISILIPNDPGMLYRLLRQATTLRVAKRENLYDEAQLVHALEHRNHYLQLESLLNHTFQNDQVETNSFPLRLRNYNFNALTVFHVTKQ